MTHNLKTWPEYFNDVRIGDKTFEIRRDDRNFQVADAIVLEEWSPASEAYTGNVIVARVGYVLRNVSPLFGLADGFCILQLEDIDLNQAHCVNT